MKTELLGIWSAIAFITLILVLMMLGQNSLWKKQIKIDEMIIRSTTPL